MSDASISVNSQVECSCGWFGSVERLNEGSTTPAHADVPRSDFRCPSCKRVLAYGSVVLGMYAKAGVEVTHVFYDQ